MFDICNDVVDTFPTKTNIDRLLVIRELDGLKWDETNELNKLLKKTELDGIDDPPIE